MAIWKVSVKRNFHDGVVKFEPGMEVEFVLNSSSTSPSSVYASKKEYRTAIAQSFISEYGLKCSVEQFAPHFIQTFGQQPKYTILING